MMIRLKKSDRFNRCWRKNESISTSDRLLIITHGKVRSHNHF
ncbi:hypothetical protein [Nostoc sp. FACHB-110]|nr:hypothetical protein [Nostoc sp. FACHB-110]